jgi:O-antigen ligase
VEEAFGERTDSLLLRVLVGTCIVTTLAIAPEFLLDPFNSIKMSTLVLGTLVSISLFLPKKSSKKSGLGNNLVLKVAMSCFLIVIFAFLFSLINGEDFTRSVWGVFGRNTGLLTYLSLISIFWLGTLLKFSKQEEIFIKGLLSTTYIVLAYAFVQWLQLDPISWSNRDLVSFLGNINFVSGLFGMTGSVLVLRLLNKEANLLMRLHSISILFLLFIYWLETGSVQGLLMLIFVLFFFGTLRLCQSNWIKKYFWSIVLLGISIPIFSLNTLGTSIPLRLPQVDTLYFRIDYWLAAVSMIKSSPFWGKGIDSYGLYYREFRLPSALERGSPDRTSNTAHNIFLDVGVSAGVLALLALATLFLMTIVVNVNKIRASQALFYGRSAEVLGVFVAYFIYCLISINQIGVSVWGWLAGGLLLSNYQSSLIHLHSKGVPESKLNHRVNLKRNTVAANNRGSTSLRIGLSTFSISKLILGVMIGVFILLPYTSNQLKFLNALKKNDLQIMREIAVEGRFVDDYLKETYMEKTIARNDIIGTREIAQSLITTNPRNFYALTTLVNLTDSDTKERREIARKLMQIDPLNIELKKDLEEIISSP